MNIERIFFIVWFVLLVLGVCYIVYKVIRLSEIEKEQQNAASFSYAPPFPIDVVFTWAGEHVKIDMRQRDNSELKFSLRSVVEYLPWINKIFIVMNSLAVPSWFSENYGNKVILLDHDKIFTDEIPTDRPVTNSNSIESALTNIEGLSEHFIYFNDDVFVTNYLPYTYFFTTQGEALVQQLKEQDINNSIAPFKTPAFCKGNYPHVPYPFRKSAFNKFKALYLDYYAMIRKTKTRKTACCPQCSTFKLPCNCQQFHGIFANFMIKNGYGYPATRVYDVGVKNIKQKLSYINHTNFSVLSTLTREDLHVTLCINDTTNDREKSQKFQIEVLQFMSRMFPLPATFEKDTVQIPRMIHQTWKTHKVPAHLEAYTHSWRKLNPGFSYKLYSDSECVEFVKTWYPQYLKLYNAMTHPVERADIFRYLIIHKYGGIYADLDAKCLLPLEPILNASLLVGNELGNPIGYREKQLDQQLLQWFFAAKPEHEVFINIMEDIKRRYENPHTLKTDVRYATCSPKIAYTLWLTGPWVFSDEIHKYIKKENSSLVKIMPECFFGCYNRPEIFVSHGFEGSWK